MCVALCSSVVLSTSHASQSTKLSLPFAPGPARGDVERFQVSPDGTWVVYLAKQDSGVVSELFGRLANGSGGALKLNAPLIEGATIRDFRVCPGGERVLYEAEVIDGTTTHVGLYTVPIDGHAAAVQLDGPASNNEDVTSFQITPDGSRVVFLKGFVATNSHRLFSADTDGSGEASLISGTLNARAPVLDPEGTCAVFGASDGNLYSVPVLGGVTPLLLSGSESLTGRHLITPDGTRVVYFAGTALFSTPLDGSAAPVLLSGTFPVSDLGLTPQSVQFSADGARVLFNNADYPQLVLSVPIDGSAAPIVVADSPMYAVSPDSPYFVFQKEATLQLFRGRVDGSENLLFIASPTGTVYQPEVVAGGRAVWMHRVGGRLHLFSAPLDASGPALRLDPATNPDGEVQDYRLAPDGASIAYVADQEVDNRRELFRVPTDGSAPSVKLNPALVPGGEVSGPLLKSVFEFSPDGLHVLYQADQETSDVVELFRVSTDGSGDSHKLNEPLAPTALGDVLEVQSTSDGTFAVYRATSGLYGVPTDGSAPAVRLDGPPVSSPVDSFAIAPGGDRVAFLTGPWTTTTAELYGAPLDGSAAPVRLDGGLVPGGNVRSLRMAPDGQRAVFLADKDSDDVFELYVVPLDGSALPLKLSGPLVPGGTVGNGETRFEISGAGPRLVYIASQLVAGRRDLFSVPLDGSAPAVRLGGTPAQDFQLTPEGSQVVYLRERSFADGLSRGDLFAVPTDGSAAATRLNPTGFGSRIFRYVVGPTHVAFAADPTPGQVQVYAVPFDAGTAPVRLNDPLTGSANTFPSQARLTLSPDGTRVVYLLSPHGVLELFGAPVDGSMPARKLSHALAPGASVYGYEAPRVSPDGIHVLYRTDNLLAGTSLHVVPIRGGAPAIRLDPTVLPGSVASAAFSPDGSKVLFLTNDRVPRETELLAVPVWGGPHVRLSGLQHPWGDVTTFSVGLDGRVLYIADQETDEVFELYVSTLPRWKVRRAP